MKQDEVMQQVECNLLKSIESLHPLRSNYLSLSASQGVMESCAQPAKLEASMAAWGDATQVTGWSKDT